MSGEQRRPEASQGAPWSLDLLADLHAGALDEDTAASVRQGAEADPEAAEILAALDATTTDLADPAPLPMPDDVTTRIERALADEARSWSHDQHDQQAAAGPPPEWTGTGSAAGATGAGDSDKVVDLARGRRRRYGWSTGILVAAAVSGIAVLAPSLSRDDNSPEQANQAQVPSGSADTTPTPSGPPTLALHGDPEGTVSLNGAQFRAAMGAQQYHSSLSDPAAMLACLRANGIHSGKPLGAREVTVDGRPAQLFILPGGQLGQFRILTVGTSCGTHNPDPISDGVFGGM